MTEYQASQLTEKPKGEYEVQPISERVASVLTYSIALTYILRELMKETKTGVLSAYRLGDIGEEHFFGLHSSGDTLVNITKPKVRKVFEEESISHTRRFIASLKKALGIDVSLFARNTDNHTLLKTYLEKNTSLITSMKNDMIKRVEQQVYNAKINNDSTSKLSRALQKEFGLMKNRADLIASDQLSKLNADFNKARQQQAGMKDYEWDYQHGIPRKTSREYHKFRHGKRFKFGQPSGDEPSYAIGCKCRHKMTVVVK